MLVVRGMAWGVVVVSLIIGAVATVANPSMTGTEILYAFWPNWMLLALAFVVLAFTERRGAL